MGRPIKAGGFYEEHHKGSFWGVLRDVNAFKGAAKLKYLRIAALEILT